MNGTMTCHAAVYLQPGVLMMRKTSCYGSCCFHCAKYVLGCKRWREHLLFPQPTPVPVSQYTVHQEEKQAETLTSGSSRSDHGFDAIYYVGEEHRVVQDGTVRVNSFHPVVGKVVLHYRTPREARCGLSTLRPLVFAIISLLLITVS